MEQAKKPGIAEAIDLVAIYHDLMLSDMYKDPSNMMAIMHEWHQKLIDRLIHMERASRTEPEPEPEPQPPTTSDSQRPPTGEDKTGGETPSPPIDETASSARSYATVRRWLEGVEDERA